MNYCSHCGSAELSFTVPEGDNRARYVCAGCGAIHYTNPKIVTGCLPIWEEQVLLCRRAIEPRLGYWNVPGGFLENGETVEQGAIREVWEEALAEVTVQHVHAIFSLPHINQVYIHFLARLNSLEFRAGEESLEVQLFHEAEIPWNEIAFSSTTFSLERYFRDRQNGSHQVHVGRVVRKS